MDLSPVVIAIITASVPFILGLAGREVASFGLAIKKKLSSNPKTIALCAVVDVAEDASTAAIEAVEENASKGVGPASLAGLQAAIKVFQAEESKLIDAAAAESKALLVKQGLPAVIGNVSVNLPEVK